MAYSINPNLPKARATAMKLLIQEGLPLQAVANKCGVHRSTIYRWKRKWEVLNKDWQMDNPNRPNRVYSRSNHLSRCAWCIPTLSTRPHTNPTAISTEIVQLVLAVRQRLKRCAEVVWYQLTTLGVLVDGIRQVVTISLSSVRRILKRHHCFDGARKSRVRSDNPKRPLPTKPGELVQVDTVHHVDLFTGRRLYHYTVIDLYSRMSYVAMSTKLGVGHAATAVLAAQKHWRQLDSNFSISMTQTDNGLEFSKYFEQQMKRAGIATRHTRLSRPNDNAHIERFNRTLQEECIGRCWRRSVPLLRQQEKLSCYIDYYNQERVHLGIQMRTPSQMLQRY